MSWSPKVALLFQTSSVSEYSDSDLYKFYKVADFKTSAGYMDYLMSVGLIKTATTIWIGWITIKNPTKYNMKDLSFIFF